MSGLLKTGFAAIDRARRTGRWIVLPIRRRKFRKAAAPALRHWGIRHFTVIRNLGGSARASWLLEAEGRRFVARRIVGNRDYLDYQLTTLAHLAQASLPIHLPKPQRTSGGALIHNDGVAAWVLYPFIEAAHPDARTYARLAGELGIVVGLFDEAAAKLDLGAQTGNYRLPLFQAEDVLHLRNSPRGSAEPDDSERDRALQRALTAHEAILPAAREAVSRLPLQTIYNDWHPSNILERDGRIVGLIDFDSLVEAPRIVDVQNALAHLLMSSAAPDLAIVREFLSGYESAAPLSSEERPLLWPVMLDRLLWLVSDIRRERERVGRSARDGLEARAIRLLDWIVRTGRASQGGAVGGPLR